MAIDRRVGPHRSGVLEHVRAGRRESPVAVDLERLIDRAVRAVVLRRTALPGHVELNPVATPDARGYALGCAPRANEDRERCQAARHSDASLRHIVPCGSYGCDVVVVTLLPG